MGYMRHHAIVVTSWSDEHIVAAHSVAKTLFSAVSEIITSPVNRYKSFMVAPDGSKEGWDDSNSGDGRRANFVMWLDGQRFEDDSSPLAWAEIQYGDDELETKIVNDSDARRRLTGEST